MRNNEYLWIYIIGQADLSALKAKGQVKNEAQTRMVEMEMWAILYKKASLVKWYLIRDLTWKK